MKRKLPNTTNKIVPPLAAILILLIIWQVVSMTELVPSFMLPSPVQVVQALIADFPLLLSHAGVTLLETFIGLIIGIIVGFGLAVLMDRFSVIRHALYPLIVLTQTIPTVAIAPLLVLWFGYEMLPKIILIVLVVFFPIAVNMLDGFRSVDRDTVSLLRSMGRQTDFPLRQVPCGTRRLFRESQNFSLIRGCQRRHFRMAGRLQRLGSIHDKG